MPSLRLQASLIDKTLRDSASLASRIRFPTRTAVAEARARRRDRVQPQRGSRDRRFGDAKLIRKFGDVPEDLSAL